MFANLNFADMAKQVQEGAGKLAEVTATPHDLKASRASAVTEGVSILSEETGDPQKASCLMVGIEARETCVSELQSAKVSLPIAVTEAGISMEVMAVL